MQPLDISSTVKAYERTRRHMARLRWLHIVLVFCITFFLLLCITGIFLWLFNPDHLISESSSAARTIFWATTSPHVLFVTLWLISLLLLPLFISMLRDKPTAILLYIFDVQSKGKPDRKLYSMLSSNDNKDQSPQHVPDNQSHDVQPAF